MAVEPSHAASKFLVDIFGASTACPIFIASLANSDAKKDARREGPRRKRIARLMRQTRSARFATDRADR